MTAEEDTRVKEIAELNDEFRRSFEGGRVVISRGVHVLSTETRQEIIRRVQHFTNFTEDNDPYGEHDFGSFSHGGQTIFWKIDYYDKDVRYGSKNPSNPKQTTRVLTIMRASEY